jgi:hypothetical protein
MEEMIYLQNHSVVEQSLNQYQNLVDFMQRMLKLLGVDVKESLIQDSTKLNFYFVLPPNPEDVGYPPKLYLNTRIIEEI